MFVSSCFQSSTYQTAKLGNGEVTKLGFFIVLELREKKTLTAKKYLHGKEEEPDLATNSVNDQDRHKPVISSYFEANIISLTY